MKKLFMVVVAVFIAYNAKAQTDTISWLTSEARATSYGTNNTSGGTIGAFMEFYSDDILNFNLTGKRLDSIRQIQFHIDTQTDYRPRITACAVIIKQGKDLASATEVVKQQVDLTMLQLAWNSVDLKTVYPVDATQNLYIGYQLQLNGDAFPFTVSAGSNPKQSWLAMEGVGILNVAVDKHTLLIKAVADTVASSRAEISLTTLNISPNINLLGDSIAIKGVVKNIGTDSLTSFKLFYEVNGVQSSVEEYTGLNIAPNATYTFTHPKYHLCSAARVDSVSVIVSEPNGVSDMGSNNIKSAIIEVYANRIQRVVLHEGFTSSTCDPCVLGNTTINNILGSVDSSKWANIRYQMYWPGNGDPYYTTEGGIRSLFYGVNSVPHLQADGLGFSGITSNYSVAKFNTLEVIPAAATMSGTATITDKTVALNVSINPVIKMHNPNLRFFAAVIEKITVKNTGTNGEKEFANVMKKFMTSPYGDSIASFDVNVPVPLNYSYTFKGNYRLPPHSGNPINHASEHSVERFSYLMVVYWLQDIVTKEVYQSGKADPNPGTVSVVDLNAETVTVQLYPNPADDYLYIQTNVDIKQLEIYNIQGQRIKTKQTNGNIVAIDNLASGIYMLRITSDKGVSTHKFVKN